MVDRTVQHTRVSTETSIAGRLAVLCVLLVFVATGMAATMLRSEELARSQSHAELVRSWARADVIRSQIRPTAHAALLCDGGVQLDGDAVVCGFDHAIETVRGDLPGHSEVADGDSERDLFGIMTSGARIGIDDNASVVGVPSSFHRNRALRFPSLARMLDVSSKELTGVLTCADRTFASPGEWKGVCHLVGNQSLESLRGEGLLYVEGDLQVGDDFAWVGLVYVEGALRVHGHPWFLGSVVVRGTPGGAAIEGAPTILFSREALDRALDVARPELSLVTPTR